MKRRGLASPDLGDCLAMSFAVQVAARQKPKSQLVYNYFPGSQPQLPGWAANRCNCSSATTTFRCPSILDSPDIARPRPLLPCWFYGL